MGRRDRVLVGGVIALVVVLSIVDWTASRGAELPELKAAIEAAQALVAVTVALLLYGRVRRTGTLNDAVLVASMALLAVNSTLLIVTLSWSFGTGASNGITWARIAARVLASAGMAAAALGPDRPWADVRRPASLLGASVAAGLVVVGLSGGALPIAIVRRRSGSYRVDGGLRVLLVVVVVLLVLATIGFVRRARTRPEPLTRAFALGCFVATFSWIEFVGRPTVYTQDVYIGDLLRLGFWMVLLAGATREVVLWWREVAHVAVREERRRIARDVHDGLAQELAFITQQSQLLLEGDAPPDAQQQVVSSAQRALDESRRAIAALRDVEREPLQAVLANAANEVAARVGTRVHLRVRDVELSVEAREALVRIVREAVANAGRHGRAPTVDVLLDDDRVLRIIDDGSGFDPTDAPVDGRYGLLSMRERAEGIGAHLAIRRNGERGMVVEVVLP